MDPHRSQYAGTPYNQNLSVENPPHRLLTVLGAVGSGQRVLEVGCHTGYFSALLRRQQCSVVGVEVNADAALLATPIVDEIIVADVEDPSAWAEIKGSFDVALFMDVLEHLVNPWAVLRRVGRHLGPDGRVLASLPNVACWSIRRELLRGRFVPPATGLHDPSHLRFFTLSEMDRLFEDAGFVVTNRWPLWTSVPLMHRLRFWPVLARRWRDWWVAHYPNLAIAVPLIEGRPR